MISMVAAMGKNNAIGFEGHLPWGKTMKNDIKRYSELIAGHTIVMGANTFNEQDHARSKSDVVVLTRQEIELPKGVRQVHSVGDVTKLAKPGEELFITGGGGVFHLMIEQADKLYLTVIDEEFEADVFFPDIEEEVWVLTNQEDYKKDENNKFNYSFRTYERKP